MQNEEQKIRREREDVEGFRNWLTERECAKHTIQKYVTDVHTFFRFLGKESQVDKGRMLEYREWLLLHYAGASVNSMLAALNQFLEYLGQDRLKLKRLRIQKKLYQEETKYLSRKEYFRLVDTARRKGREQLALIMETIGSTGIRISELSYFTADGVRAGKIHVWNKGKYRVVLLPEHLRKRLKAFMKKEGRASGPVFCTRNGEPKDRSNIWREMKELSREAGVEPEKVFPHNLRHLFARIFYRVTGNLTNLAGILGHSSLEATRVYTADGLEQLMRDIGRVQILGKKITT